MLDLHIFNNKVVRHHKINLFNYVHRMTANYEEDNSFLKDQHILDKQIREKLIHNIVKRLIKDEKIKLFKQPSSYDRTTYTIELNVVDEEDIHKDIYPQDFL